MAELIDDPAEVLALLKSENFSAVKDMMIAPKAVETALHAKRAARAPMMKTVEDFKSSPIIDELREYLSAIGAKLAPSMSPAVASAWIDALCVSLGKWPSSVALAAAKRARHEPIPHGINGVDEVLHKIAAPLDEKLKATIAMLETLKWEIARAARASNRIEHKPEVWTQAGIDEANELFRRIGARTRYTLVDGACVSNLEPLFTIEDAQRESKEFDTSEKDGHISNHGGNHEEE